jgi:hypothetical protein
MPEFISDLKELYMLPLVYGIACKLKKFSDTENLGMIYVVGQ